MSWDFMQIRSAEDADGGLYPLVGAGPYHFAPEDGDGHVIGLSGRHLTMRRVHPGGVTDPVVRTGDVAVEVYLTEKRSVFACKHWNKGDRYWGIGLGATSALTKNVTNNLTERAERRGSIALGHIRHNWLSDVAFQQAKGLMGRDVVRFVVRTGTPQQAEWLIVDVQFPKSAHAIALADRALIA